MIASRISMAIFWGSITRDDMMKVCYVLRQFHRPWPTLTVTWWPCHVFPHIHHILATLIAVFLHSSCLLGQKNPRLDPKIPAGNGRRISQRIEIFHPNLEPQGQPFINGCFNWMIPNLCIGNGRFTKHLFINGCLGFQEKWRVFFEIRNLSFCYKFLLPSTLRSFDRAPITSLVESRVNVYTFTPHGVNC